MFNTNNCFTVVHNIKTKNNVSDQLKAMLILKYWQNIDDTDEEKLIERCVTFQITARAHTHMDTHLW